MQCGFHTVQLPAILANITAAEPPVQGAVSEQGPSSECENWKDWFLLERLDTRETPSSVDDNLPTMAKYSEKALEIEKELRALPHLDLRKKGRNRLVRICGTIESLKNLMEEKEFNKTLRYIQVFSLTVKELWSRLTSCEQRADSLEKANTYFKKRVGAYERESSRMARELEKFRAGPTPPLHFPHPFLGVGRQGGLARNRSRDGGPSFSLFKGVFGPSFGKCNREIGGPPHRDGCRSGCRSKADRWVSLLIDTLKGLEGVRVYRPVKPAEMRMLGLENSATPKL
ncbi:unnamed protein product [Lasius platythorax]|uniref:Uncharacterized protein n=1 Tax=Lasius platythorax TaxID=488582 RepID=A0AAV2MVN5_9HYME